MLADDLSLYLIPQYLDVPELLIYASLSRRHRAEILKTYCQEWSTDLDTYPLMFLSPVLLCRGQICRSFTVNYYTLIRNWRVEFLYRTGQLIRVKANLLRLDNTLDLNNQQQLDLRALIYQLTIKGDYLLPRHYQLALANQDYLPCDLLRSHGQQLCIVRGCRLYLILDLTCLNSKLRVILPDQPLNQFYFRSPTNQELTSEQAWSHFSFLGEEALARVKPYLDWVLVTTSTGQLYQLRVTSDLSRLEPSSTTGLTLICYLALKAVKLWLNSGARGLIKLENL